MQVARAVWGHRWSVIGFAAGVVVFTVGAIRVHGGDGGSVRSVGSLVIVAAVVRLAYEASVDRDRLTYRFLRCSQRIDK